MNIDDAVILHYLLKYKIRDKRTVTFPKEALGKVSEILKQNYISYEIISHHNYYVDSNNYE